MKIFVLVYLIALSILLHQPIIQQYMTEKTSGRLKRLVMLACAVFLLYMRDQQLIVLVGLGLMFVYGSYWLYADSRHSEKKSVPTILQCGILLAHIALLTCIYLFPS